MKKIISLLFSILLLASCSQELVDNPIKEGPEVKVHFDFTTKPMTAIGTKGIDTRSVLVSDVDESGLVDMWIVQFDGSGNFIRKVYNPDVSNAVFDAPLTAGTSTLYFLANIGPSLISPDTEANFILYTKTITADTEALLLSGGKKYIPMSAKLTSAVIPSSGFMEKMTVSLVRMLARIDVTYTPSTLTNFNFEGLRLCNVPNVQYVAPATATTTPTTLSSSFGVKTLTPETMITTGDATTAIFYIPDNQKGVGANTGTTNERLKGGVPDATYIEFYGTTTGAQGGYPVGLDIYLGANNYNDYNLVRNTKYVVNASLTNLSPSDQRVKIKERPNCYMVNTGGVVTIPVIHANDTNELGIQLADVRTGWTPMVYWQSAVGLVTVSSADIAKGYFKVTANGTTTGNALVAIKDGSGNILWSWHIWVMNIDVTDPANQEIMTTGSNTNVCMRLNLGATAKATGTVASDDYKFTGGLMYQWGRKDPFQGTNVISNTNPTPYPLYNEAGGAFVPPTYTSASPTIPATIVASNDTYLYKATVGTAPIGTWNQVNYSVKYPMLFLISWNGSTAKGSADINDGADSWGGEYGQSKSPYDPCPAGWRVPSAKRFSTTATGIWPAAYTGALSATVANGNTGVFNNSYVYTAGGRRMSDGTFAAVGGYGFYWFANRNSVTTGQISYLVPTTPSILNNDTFGYGENIRCVRNWN